MNKPDDVIACSPELTIRSLFKNDADLKTIFSPEQIAGCEAIVEQARRDSADKLHKNIQTLKQIYLDLSLAPSEMLDSFMEEVTRLKSLASFFGKSSIVKITDVLLHKAPAVGTGSLPDGKEITLLGKLIDLLQAVSAAGDRLDDAYIQRELSLLLEKA